MRRFFNKLLMIYIAIIIAAICTLSIFITNTVISILQKNEMEYVKLVLNNINAYIDEKYDNIINITKNVYIDNYTKTDILTFIVEEYLIQDEEYYRNKRIFDHYMNSFFSRDNDIVSIVLYKKLDKNIYYYSKDYVEKYSSKEYDNTERLVQIADKYPFFKLYPSSLKTYTRGISRTVYTYSHILKDPKNPLRNIGLLMFDLDTEGFSSILSNYTANLKGSILALTSQGEVIYDSSRQYYSMKYPYYNLLPQAAGWDYVNNENCLINISTANKMGLTIVSIMPESEVFKSIKGISTTIVIITVITLVAALAFTIFGTTVFSKRVNIILKFIRKVRQGNLSERIPLPEIKDEIGEISESFNKMCRDLQNYIDKVYVSEINQRNAQLKLKSAQLTALQAQINPHFLFNTLEAIRMKAVTGGNNEVGKMIFILSKLFRNSIKNDQIVDIAEEIDNIKLYLELFKIRYGDRLNTEFDISEDIIDYGIIRHILQPIIENYLMYGFDSNKQDNRILIHGFEKDGFIFIIVKDNGQGIEAEKLACIKANLKQFDLSNTESLGLANIHERLKIVYGDTCGIEIWSKYNTETIVTIKLMAKSKRELKENVQGIIS